MSMTEQMEQKLAQNLSMKMLIAARPEVEALLNQAFRAGFADGALYQAISLKSAFQEVSNG